jgi:hypothetical protein
MGEGEKDGGTNLKAPENFVDMRRRLMSEKVHDK